METRTNKGRARAANLRNKLDDRAMGILLDTISRSSDVELVDAIVDATKQISKLRDRQRETGESSKPRINYLVKVRGVLLDMLEARRNAAVVGAVLL